MLKLSPAGDSLWQRPLPGKSPDHITCTNDNHFLLLSQVANGIILSKTDLEGYVLWTRQISHIDLDDEMTGLTHFEMSDDTILVVSQTSQPLYYDYLTRFQLFNADGDSLHEFTLPSFGSRQKVLSVYRLNNAEVLVSGIYSGELHENQSFLANVNVANGAVVWQKPVLEDLIFSRLMIAGVSNDKVLISGGVQFSVNAPKQALSMGITFDGDILFYRGYGENVIHEVAGVCLASDGGIVAAGSTYYNNNTKGFLMKTDRDGFVNVLGAGSGPGLTPVSCYPNPADDRLCIEAAAGIRMVELFDATGRLAGRFSFKGEMKVTLSLQDIRPGLLTVKVLHDQRISLKKIINR
ncbi:MAG: T9SS type A sorting domain-containing protein [Bacteroidales bacterium]|nr:T9SS type A sorting domain-containing protein [Bacteroidales bacterium]